MEKREKEHGTCCWTRIKWRANTNGSKGGRGQKAVLAFPTAKTVFFKPLKGPNFCRGTIHLTFAIISICLSLFPKRWFGLHLKMFLDPLMRVNMSWVPSAGRYLVTCSAAFFKDWCIYKVGRSVDGANTYLHDSHIVLKVTWRKTLKKGRTRRKMLGESLKFRWKPFEVT